MESETTNNTRSERTYLYQVFCKYITPVMIGIIFVAAALVFAIIFSGARRFTSSTPKYIRSKVVERNFNNNSIKNSEKHSNRNSIKFVSILEYPFIAALVSNDPLLYFCTAVILTKRYLLTGANCFNINFNRNLFIKVGSDVWPDSKGKLYGIEIIIINKHFHGVTQEYNIALIKVNRSIELSETTKTVELAEKNLTLSRGVTLGWNFWTTAIAERNYMRMMEEELHIWNPGKCKDFLGNKTSSRCGFICASLTESICTLGVVGPLIVERRLVGIWSWGLSCPKVPSIFIDVRFFREWIKKLQLKLGLNKNSFRNIQFDTF